jgi:hypothetical protein
MAQDLDHALGVLTAKLNLTISVPASDARRAKYLKDARQAATDVANLARWLLASSEGEAPETLAAERKAFRARQLKSAVQRGRLFPPGDT